MNFNISNLATLVFSVTKAAEPQKPLELKSFDVAKEAQQNLQQANVQTNLPSPNPAVIIVKTPTVMNNMQLNMFLRDMLNLPKDWLELMVKFSSGQNDTVSAMLKNLAATNNQGLSSEVLKLLQSNAKVDLLALAQLLKNNSGLLADKLLRLVNSSGLNQSNIAQMKEIMLIGASLALNAQTNPAEFIRNIIQMYLPWLPLLPPQQKDLEEIMEQAGKKEKDNSQVLFYISTEKSGYFKIEIILLDEPEIFITHIVEKADDEVKYKILDNLKTIIKKHSLRAKFFFSQRAENSEEKPLQKQLYIVNSTDSMIGLSLIQLIARVIFEFDEKYSLQQTREDRLKG
ncbi:MAG: hypothetical protein PHX18_05400 [Candidatus Gastranaerophilales bacterium]|nr:hypothetical protein [Candidatus Gastranaerophilales bacterium]